MDQSLFKAHHAEDNRSGISGSTKPGSTYSLSCSIFCLCLPVFIPSDNDRSVSASHESLISEASLTKLSLTDVVIGSSDEVTYEEVDSEPGITVEHSDGTLSWSPVKFSKRRVKPASAASSVSDLDITECLCIDYQKRDNVLGVETETSDNIFWVPIAHCTRSRLRTPSGT